MTAPHCWAPTGQRAVWSAARRHGKRRLPRAPDHPRPTARILRDDRGLPLVPREEGGGFESPVDGDRCATRSPLAADDSGRASQMTQDQSIDEIPEVIRFQLRYFDGFVWRNQWDSQREQALPVAVEVQFDLQQPTKPKLQPLPEQQGVGIDVDTRLGSEDLLNDEAEQTTVEEANLQRSTRGLARGQIPQHRLVIYLGRHEDGGDAATGTAFDSLPGAEGGPTP